MFLEPKRLRRRGAELLKDRVRLLALASAFLPRPQPPCSPQRAGVSALRNAGHRLRSALATTPGRLPLLLRTGKLFLEGLHDKEARGQIPFLGVIVEVKLHDLH